MGWCSRLLREARFTAVICVGKLLERIDQWLQRPCSSRGRKRSDWHRPYLSLFCQRAVRPVRKRKILHRRGIQTVAAQRDSDRGTGGDSHPSGCPLLVCHGELSRRKKVSARSSLQPLR